MRSSRYAAEGFRRLGLGYEPGRSEEEVEARFAGVRAKLGLAVGLVACTHAPPSPCWCRKPLPGLGGVLIERHALDLPAPSSSPPPPTEALRSG